MFADTEEDALGFAVPAYRARDLAGTGIFAD